MAATTGMAGFLTRVRHTLAPDDRPDAELVRDYLRTRSDEAFAELVRRFAPMVWGVCRRTVGHVQSAEDAFQAVFFVLARKAATIRPPAAVGGWLHGVAVHTSMRARAMTDRRRKAQSPLDADHPANPLPSSGDADDLRALDEEIAKLPEPLRATVALCELDGVSRRDAAQRLGIAEGTLSSRLATARKRLAARLRSRGVSLGVGGVAALIGGRAAGAVPPVVASVSETVTDLAEGAIRAMFLNKLKVLSAGVLAAALLAVVGVTAMSPAATPDQRHVRRNAPVPKADKEGVILVGVQEDSACRIELCTPKGEKVATIPLGDVAFDHPTLSRDGRRVAVWARDSLKLGRPNRAGDDTMKGTLRVYDLDQPDEPVAKFEHRLSGRILFAPDGQCLYALEQGEPAQPNKATEFVIYRFDLKSKTKEKLGLPANHQLADISPDGQALLTTTFDRTGGKLQARPYRVPLDTLKPEPLTKESVRALRFSPDGKRFVAIKYLDPNDGWKQGLTVVDVKTGQESAVKLEDDTATIWHVAWAPDGKRLVVHRYVKLGLEKANGPRPIPAGGGGPLPDMVPIQKPEVAVRNLDGSEPKVVLDTKRESHVFGVDWR
jgi:RNA polymerase sigma factor (sigma-70 family)